MKQILAGGRRRGFDGKESLEIALFVCCVSIISTPTCFEYSAYCTLYE